MGTRRDFIRKSSTAALSLLIPWPVQMRAENQYIGIQLYTIREKLAKEFEGSLGRISEIGFNAVETANYYERKFYGYTPGEFRKITQKLHLKALSSHAQVPPAKADEVIEDTLEAGMEYLVQPSIHESDRKTADDYRKIADQFNRIGEKCRDAGLRFGYHNHEYEFKALEGQIPFDILLERTQTDLVTMQLDTYWVAYAGLDPLDYFQAYPGRFELLHIKDMEDTPEKGSTEIGSGTLDWRTILGPSTNSGMRYFFLEQESFRMDMFESLAISYAYLRSIQ